MKKLLLSTAALLAIVPSFARTLSPEEALARVTTHNAGIVTSAASTPKLIATGEYEGITTYYVYSDKNSAMILSADDLALPVIGYLDSSVSETTPMPEQLIWWLEKYGKALKDAKANETQSLSLNGTVINSYANIPAGTLLNGLGKVNNKTASYTDIAPLLKTTWDQGAPYNDLCPSGCVTGCVATAMSQVMKYHAYPDQGTGYVSTVYNGRTLSMTLDGVTLDWANMLDSYPTGTSGTEAQRNAVATLMKATGYSVKMSYGSSSGAVANAMVPALVNNFKYDVATEFHGREFYTDEEWTEMVYNELAANRPVLYAGSGASGGHQFVCDGYISTSGYFHFNWGWSGSYDGYFALNKLVPAGQGAGGNNGEGFNEGQCILTGVQKPVEGSVRPEAYMAVTSGTLTGSASGRTITLNINNGTGLFCNYSSSDASFDIGYSLTDASGNVTYKAIYSDQFLAVGYGFRSLNITIPSTVTDGTYQLSPVYRIAGDSEWKIMKIGVYDPKYVTLEISGANITVTNHPSNNPNGPEPQEWTFSGAKTSTGFKAGEKFDFAVTITNPNADEESRQLAAVVIDSEYYIQGEFENYIQLVTLAGGESKEVSFEGEIFADVPAGSYYLVVMDAATMTLLQAWNIDVKSDIVESNIEITSITPSSTELTVGQDFTTVIKAINSGTTFESIEIALYFCQISETEGQLMVKGTAGGKSITVPNTGKERSFTFDCTTPTDLINGTYLLVAASGGSALAYVEVIVSGGENSISSIFVDQNTNAEYFDLQGRPVNSNSLAPGIYVRRIGNTTSKVLIK